MNHGYMSPTCHFHAARLFGSAAYLQAGYENKSVQVANASKARSTKKTNPSIVLTRSRTSTCTAHASAFSERFYYLFLLLGFVMTAFAVSCCVVVHLVRIYCIQQYEDLRRKHQHGSSPHVRGKFREKSCSRHYSPQTIRYSIAEHRNNLGAQSDSSSCSFPGAELFTAFL